MTARQLCCAALVVIAIVPSVARPAKVRIPSLEQMFAAGGFTIPTEWAGIWAFADTTRDCDTMIILDIDSGVDTLCAGVSAEPDTMGGAEFMCSGSITPTSFDFTCTSTVEIDSCTVTFTYTTQATRSGDTAVSHFRFSQSYDGPVCDFLPDICQEESESLMRIAPAPANCMTAVVEGSWGAVKSLYR